MRRCTRKRCLWWLLGLALCVNLYVTYWMMSDKSQSMKHRMFNEADLTVILREFEDFDNRVVSTVDALLHTMPRINVLVAANKLPYPPIRLPRRENVKMLVMETSPHRFANDMKLENYVKTKYVLMLPDAASVTSASTLQVALKKLDASVPNGVKMLALPVGDADIKCTRVVFNEKQWTLKYYLHNDLCDGIRGMHAVLMQTEDLLSLPAPLRRPIQESLYIQTSLRSWKIRILSDQHLHGIGPLFKDSHLAWKHKTLEYNRKKSSYQQFGVKLVHQPDGMPEWYGCTKATQRCFGTVIKEMPDYLYKGKWTPPCCLENLRTTARYVFRVLEADNVRYWLEGGSLLGAARQADIIPWDYDIDIGIYKDDMEKSLQLSRCQKESYEDESGFVWEKAPEGDFYRVHFSEMNHLHVDIFPFYSKNGIMTKNTWFKTHRQDREFPEHFLTPRTKVQFVGTEAYAPNKIKQFLELKFGEGVIENPRYPDLSKADMTSG